MNDIPGYGEDVRTVDKLIDGVNSTWSDEHMWLAPFTVGEENTLYVIFNEPVALSAIKLWNYSKTPQRGVQDFEVCDVIVIRSV